MTSGSRLGQTKQDVTSYPANKATSVLLDAPCAGPDEIDDGILSRDTGPLIRLDTLRAALFAQIGIGERDHNRMLGRGSYRAIFNTIAAFPDGLVLVIDPWHGVQPENVLKDHLARARIDRVVEIWVDVSPATAAARNRARSGERHAGHLPDSHAEELFERAKRAVPMALGPVITAESETPLPDDLVGPVAALPERWCPAAAPLCPKHAPNIDWTSDTAATGGLGGAIVRHLSEAEAEVIANGRNAETLAQLAEQTGCRTRAFDLDSEVEIRTALEGLDLWGVVNCGGFGGEITTPMKTDISVFGKVISINAHGALLVTKYASQSMIRLGKGGAVVNLSSQASLVGLRLHISYGSSKAALVNITGVSAMWLGPHGIRVHGVNRAVVMTRMSAWYWGRSLSPCHCSDGRPKMTLRQQSCSFRRMAPR